MASSCGDVTINVGCQPGALLDCGMGLFTVGVVRSEAGRLCRHPLISIAYVSFWLTTFSSILFPGHFAPRCRGPLDLKACSSSVCRGLPPIHGARLVRATQSRSANQHFRCGEPGACSPVVLYSQSTSTIL